MLKKNGFSVVSEKKKEIVEIFTDGACSGNPGPGGYGVILRYHSKEKRLCGSEPETTNNRMELTAVLVALEALKRPCDVTLYSDSKYVVDAAQKGWLEGWQKNGWRKSNKKPVLNLDLWERLPQLLAMHKVDFVWVKGHANHPENEECDKLAVMAMRREMKDET
ncbi:ribonuclease H [Clostridia bacterium]|nr:ribonuclease H [Clostridia bacterium]